MPEANGSVVIQDYAGQTATVSVNLQNADQGLTNAGTLAQDLDEFKDAIDPLVRGEIRSVNFSVKFAESAAAVTNKEASIEGKWLVSYRDTTEYLDSGNLIQNPGFGKIFKFEIPCADRTLLTGNDETLDLTAGAGLTFKTAVEPNLRSPYNRAAGAGVTPTQVLVEVRYVGRNL